MEALAVQLVVPFHAPLCTSEQELERLTDEVLAPTLGVIGRAGDAKVALHLGGHILDYLSRRHEELLIEIKRLAKMGQIEILGGLFYGGVPSMIAELDVRGQIEMLGEYWESLTGTTPEGFWMPQRVWSAELVRLMDESGLRYGYVGSQQLRGLDGTVPPIGTLAHGGLTMAAFVLDDMLSNALAEMDVDTWIEKLLGAADNRELVTLWLQTDAWRTNESVRQRVFRDGWLEQLLVATGGARIELQSVLPAKAFDFGRPATHLHLIEHTTERASQTHPMVEYLAMRMQRASDKLREAITMMEEESLEDTWSDGLATAQRLVFAAQAPDAYLPPSDGDSTWRQAQESCLARLIEAELTIDALMQGPDDWLTVEEEDRDGDLVDEVILGNARIAAWMAPAEDGSLVTVDDRQGRRNLIAVGPQHDRVRTWLLEEGTTSEEFFAGGALDLVRSSTPCEITERRDDEEAGAFSLTVRQENELEGGEGRRVRLHKQVRLPVEGAEVRLTLDAEAQGTPSTLLVTEIPLSLGRELPRLWVDGNEENLASRGFESASELRLLGAQGAGIEVRLDPPQEVWIGGVLGPDDVGVVVVPILRLASSSHSDITLRLLDE